MKTHRTDGVSLVSALIFLAIVAWWLVAKLVDLALPAVGWFLAGALILVGILGLLGALRTGRHAEEPSGKTAAPASDSPVEPETLQLFKPAPHDPSPHYSAPHDPPTGAGGGAVDSDALDDRY